MRMLRLGLAQINATVGDLDGNFAKVVRAIDSAREQGVDVLAFPELVMTGYPPEDLLLKPAFIARVIERTHDLLPHTKGMTVVVGTLERDRDLYNAAAVLHDGAYAGSARKIWLPNYGVFDEKRYFAAAETCGVFARGELRFGVNVCEDIWVEGGPTEDQVARGGAELILNLSASPYHAGKADERRRMVATRAADNLAVVGYVNLVGGQDEVVFDGGSMVLDPRGRVIAQGALFAEDLVIADVNLDDVFHARLQDTRLRRGRDADGADPIEVVTLSALPAAAPASPARTASAPQAERESSESAEVYSALVLATRDYVRKNGFDTVTLGLSGGIDSALTACVAVDALGPDKVVGVLMPSEYTSQVSLDTALELGRRLGIRTMTLPIADVMRAYEGALAEPFTGRAADVTEENLQARIRGNYLMALSNKFGWLVLITGNKSEMSVGYSTLYGDMAGGFGVLKDVYKTQVYELSHWRNANAMPGGPEGPVIPDLTITRAPSAELRPNQTDQDSLPPYDMLDAILRMYVEEDRSIAEIAAQGFDEATVRRVARMVDFAEYKRRQSPPGIKITTRAFGKDRRIPITNGWRG
ncbi:MAG: NAD+ synthase [Candidatus Eisenbacteria bacterium]|nr:NAD+ synthase [Candidatus Eisenbacteria bacterium]